MLTIDSASTLKYEASVLLYNTLLIDYISNNFETKEDIMYLISELDKKNNSSSQVRYTMPIRNRLLLTMYNDRILGDDEFIALLIVGINFVGFDYSDRRDLNLVISILVEVQTKHYILTYDNFTNLLIKIFYGVQLKCSRYESNYTTADIGFMNSNLMDYVATNSANVLVSIIGFMVCCKLTLFRGMGGNNLCKESMIAIKGPSVQKVLEDSILDDISVFIHNNDIVLDIRDVGFYFYKETYDYLKASYIQNLSYLPNKLQHATNLSTLNHCLGRALVLSNKQQLEDLFLQDKNLIKFFMDNAAIITPKMDELP